MVRLERYEERASQLGTEPDIDGLKRDGAAIGTRVREIGGDRQGPAKEVWSYRTGCRVLACIEEPPGGWKTALITVF